MNTENLLKLATYLLSSSLKAKFDMAIFSDIRHINNSSDCGTAGCAIGHGPWAGIDKRKDESWGAYGRRVFDISTAIKEQEREIWDWCFSSFWSEVDNTPEGAGKRILYLLRKGLPEDWYEQLIGAAELIYLNETL